MMSVGVGPRSLGSSESPFSVQVAAVAGTFRWGPFLPVQLEDRLLTLLLLTSKYRLRSIPVVEPGRGALRNLVTQSAIVRWLADCGGNDWYDSVANKTLTQVRR